MATIDEVKVTDAKFPDAKPEQLEKLKTFLNTEMADWSIPIALDRFLAALEVLEQEQTGDRGLKNEPPKIIFVSHPAVLDPSGRRSQAAARPQILPDAGGEYAFPHALRSPGQDLLPEGWRRLAGRRRSQRSLEGFGTDPGSD